MLCIGSKIFLWIKKYCFQVSCKNQLWFTPNELIVSGGLQIRGLCNPLVLFVLQAADTSLSPALSLSRFSQAAVAVRPQISIPHFRRLLSSANEILKTNFASLSVWEKASKRAREIIYFSIATSELSLRILFSFCTRLLKPLRLRGNKQQRRWRQRHNVLGTISKMVTFGKSTQTYSCGDVRAGESGSGALSLSHSLTHSQRPGCPLIRTKFRSPDQLSQKTIVFIDSPLEVESIYCCYPSRCTALSQWEGALADARAERERERGAFLCAPGGENLQMTSRLFIASE